MGSTVLPPVVRRSRPGEILTRNELAPRPSVTLGMFNLDHGFYGLHGFLAYITCSYMDINAIHRILECYQQRNQLNKHSWTIDWIPLSPLVLDVSWCIFVIICIYYKLSENESYLIFIDFLYCLPLVLRELRQVRKVVFTGSTAIGSKARHRPDKLDNSNWKWMVSPGKLMKS